MTTSTTAGRAQELRKQIQHHDHLYYVLDHPGLTDQEYDALMRELREIEKQHPELHDPDSPTQRVGGAVAAGFPEVQHPQPMLSLANAMNEEEFQDWQERITKGTGEEKFTITMEPKIDGLAMRLVYQDGHLLQAITRGNGASGEDVTHNVRTIRNIPLVLQGTPESPVPEHLEVRGEVYMSRKVFETASKAREERGDQPFRNPRNAAAGTIRQLDPALASERRLSAWIYGYAQPQTLTHHQALMTLAGWGLPVNPLIENCQSVDEAREYHQRLQAGRDALDYEIDGVVAKVNRLDLQEQMGATNREPRWAIAWKFPSGQATTTLREISISHGRFGRLTPVAVLDPVELGGVTVQSASLHNLEDIRRKDIRPGTQVVVERAGDVIPQVTGPADPEENERAELFRMPERCPSCGADVETGGSEAGHWCPNQDCPALLPEQLKSFVGKRAMEIDGLGEHYCQQLVERKLLTNTAGLYFVTREQWLTLDRMGERLANRVQGNLEASKQRPLARVLYALGIFRLGRDVSTKLAQRYSSMDEIRVLTAEELTSMDGVGPEIAQAVVAGFQSGRVNNTIKLMEQAGVRMTQDQEEKEKETNMIAGRNLAGLTFVVTGKLEGMSRNDAQMLIVQNGGKTSSSVTKSTDYLVVGEKPGSKLTKANEFGVTVIDQNQLYALIG